jgi:nuclear pore complex protein Nup133
LCLKASETLEDLALNENDIYVKRKTLLSLSKLSLMASEQTSNTQARVNLINRRLQYLEYIDTLPEGILKNLAPSKDMIPTIKADKLIDVILSYQFLNYI